MSLPHTPRRRWAAITAPALVAALILGGCGTGTPDEVITQEDPPAATETDTPNPDAETEEEAPQEETPEDTEEPEKQDGPVSPQKAVEIALGAHSGGRMINVELERNHGLTVWEVELVTSDAKFEVEVDASTGEIVKDRQERTSHLDRYNRYLDTATVSFTEMLEILEGAHPDATILEAELDEEDGTLVWELEILDKDRVEYDLEIDAQSGQILKNEIDD